MGKSRYRVWMTSTFSVPSIYPGTLSQRSGQPQNGASHPPSPALTMPEHERFEKCTWQAPPRLCCCIGAPVQGKNLICAILTAWLLLSELKALSFFWHLSILEEDLDSMALQNSSLNAQCTGILTNIGKIKFELPLPAEFHAICITLWWLSLPCVS